MCYSRCEAVLLSEYHERTRKCWVTNNFCFFFSSFNLNQISCGTGTTTLLHSLFICMRSNRLLLRLHRRISIYCYAFFYLIIYLIIKVINTIYANITSIHIRFWATKYNKNKVTQLRQSKEISHC